MAEKTLLEEVKLATSDARQRILNLLLKEMHTAKKPQARRDAAFSLIRMDWLGHGRRIAPDEMLAYLELVARYVDTSFERRYLVRHITMMLDSQSRILSQRQQAQLLVYRAAMLGQLGELDEAIENYGKAGQIADEFIKSYDGMSEDFRLAARIKLGHANVIVIRYEQATELEERPHHLEEVQIAVNLYLQALQLAQTYGRDAVLEFGIHMQLIYAHALLKNWVEAERTCNNASAVLQRVDDRDDQVLYRAQMLETVSELHLRKGRSMLPHNNLQALHEYETAYRYAQEAIDLLEQSSFESFDLVLAHNDAGEYLLAMSDCTDNKEPHLLAEACSHWRVALDIASRLGFAELAHDASTYLRRYCTSSKE